MAPILYHVPRTISSPIYQALIELGVAGTLVQIVTLSFADLKTAEHLSRNPMGTSPTLTDPQEGIAIWESGAVLTYLLECYDKDFQLSPRPGNSSLADRAKFLHLQQYILATVYPFVASLYIHTLKPKEDQDHAYVELSKAKWKNLLAPTLASFLGDSTYFMGDMNLSAIDLLVAKPLSNAHSLGILQEFPTLFALLEKAMSRPSFAMAYNPPSVPTDNNNSQEGRSLVLAPSMENF